MPEWPFFGAALACLGGALAIGLFWVPLAGAQVVLIAGLWVGAVASLVAPGLLNRLQSLNFQAFAAVEQAKAQGEKLDKLADDLRGRVAALENGLHAQMEALEGEGAARAAGALQLAAALEERAAAAAAAHAEALGAARAAVEERLRAGAAQLAAVETELKAVAAQTAEARALSSAGRDARQLTEALRQRLDEQLGALRAAAQEVLQQAGEQLRTEAQQRAALGTELRQTVAAEAAARSLAVENLRSALAAESAARAEAVGELQAGLASEAELREDGVRRAEATARAETGALAESLGVLEDLIRNETENRHANVKQLFARLEDLREPRAGGPALPTAPVIEAVATEVNRERFEKLETEIQTLRSAQEAYAAVAMATRKATGATRVPFAHRNPFAKGGLHPPAPIPPTMPPFAWSPEAFEAETPALGGAEPPDVPAVAAADPGPDEAAAAPFVYGRRPSPTPPPMAPAEPDDLPVLEPEPPPTSIPFLFRQGAQADLALETADEPANPAEPPPPVPAELLAEEPAPAAAPSPEQAPEAEQAGTAEDAPPADVIVVLISAEVPEGQDLFLRGDGGGLTWEAPAPLTRRADGQWEWRSGPVAAPVWCRARLRDEVPSDGFNMQVWPGRINRYRLTFGTA